MNHALWKRAVGLFELGMRTAHECGRADIASLGAAIAYYTLFSLTPLLLLAISILGWVLTPADAVALVTSSFVQLLPADSSGAAVANALANLAVSQDSTNALSALIGVGTLIFTASGMFGSLNKAINRVWDCPYAGHMIRNQFIAVLMVGGVIAVLVGSVLVASLLDIAEQLAESVLGIAVPDLSSWQLLSRVTSLALFALAVMVIYRMLPRCPVRWRDVWPAALLVAVAWLILKEGFAFYLAHFATYSTLYGNLGTVIALMTWIWLSSQVLLVGAALAAVSARPAVNRQALPQVEQPPA